MAYEIRDLSLGTLATTATTYFPTTATNKQFIGVQASSAEGFFKNSGTTVGVVPVGILQNRPRQNESGEIWVPGCITKLYAKGAITCGKNFWIAGHGGAYSTGVGRGAAGTPIYGPALQSASSGDIITVSFAYVRMST